MRGGRSILLACALVALAAPSASAQGLSVPPGKALGFNANLSPEGEENPSVPTLDGARAAGATHMRLGLNWRAFEWETSVSEPVPAGFSKPMGQPTGSWQTDSLDAGYLGITERGMTPVITITNAPKWASTFHTCLTNIVDQLNSTKCPAEWNKKPIVLYPAPDRFDVFKAFVSAVVQRYPGAVIEGTNEPDVQRELFARYHPPVDVVAAGQCALAEAVRATDPALTVLGPGLWRMDYTGEYLKALDGRDCFDHFNLHHYAWAEVRTGMGSAHRAHQQTLRNLLIGYRSTRTFWITETGMSDKVRYNDVQYRRDAEQIGEPLAATAFPEFIQFMLDQPDVMGVLIHSVRERSYGESGGAEGFGLLTPDYVVKQPGGGILPRFCWLVLSAGNTYPGCEGLSLPTAPAPGPPWFYKEPHLLSGDKPQVGTEMAVLFLERGQPAPNTYITWQRCNAVGLSCKDVAWQKTVYKLVSADRFSTMRVIVTISNEHGGLTRRTALSPVVG